MYDTHNIAERIRKRAKIKNVSLKTLLPSCGLGINAISQMGENKGLSSVSLAKIADYLDCSVDYLLGRTENPEVNR